MVEKLRIDERVSVPMDEIEFTAIRSSGSGGQHVNKVATAVHLRFDAASSPSLPARLKQRLMELGDHRVNADGVIIIKAQETRSQARNRETAVRRLGDLLREANREDRPRIPTRPGKRAKARRLDTKRHRGKIKELRGRIQDD